MEKFEKGNVSRAKPKLKKKDLVENNREILKKKIPSYLLFLIKNTPKVPFVIKDEAINCEIKDIYVDAFNSGANRMEASNVENKENS